MQLSGIEGEQVVLILEDHQVDGSFLELINSLLSAGEVPGLYTPEELEPLLGPLRDLASQDGFRGTLVSYFASRVKRNLHIVLIMDSSSKTFTGNCESNPAFYKSCSFQWMEGWSRESMAQSKWAWSEVNKWGTSLFSLFFLFYHRDVFIRLSYEPLAPKEIGDTCKQTKQNKKDKSSKNKSLYLVFNEGRWVREKLDVELNRVERRSIFKVFKYLIILWSPNRGC